MREDPPSESLDKKAAAKEKAKALRRALYAQAKKKRQAAREAYKNSPAYKERQEQLKEQKRRLVLERKNKIKEAAIAAKKAAAEEAKRAAAEKDEQLRAMLTPASRLPVKLRLVKPDETPPDL